MTLYAPFGEPLAGIVQYGGQAITFTWQGDTDGWQWTEPDHTVPAGADGASGKYVADIGGWEIGYQEGSTYDYYLRDSIGNTTEPFWTVAQDLESPFGSPEYVGPGPFTGATWPAGWTDPQPAPEPPVETADSASATISDSAALSIGITVQNTDSHAETIGDVPAMLDFISLDNVTSKNPTSSNSGDLTADRSGLIQAYYHYLIG